jgi:hypothetical protein
MVMEFAVMVMAETEEPPIAHGAAIRVLKQYTVKKPIFDASYSRAEDLFTATIGTKRDV